MGRTPALVATDCGGGLPVVLLHGQPGVGRDWRRVTELLVDGVRVIVPDRPGYGRTGGRAAGIAANADAVVSLLDRLGVADAVFVGHSWAGAVVLDLAARYGARVSGIVLVSSVGGAGSLTTLDRVLTIPLVGPALALSGFGALAAPGLRHWAAGRIEPRAAELADGLAPRWMSAWRSFVIEQRAMVAELPALTARLAPALTPAVVVIGESDRLVRPQSQEALAGAIGAPVVRVPNVGHLVPQDAPQAVAAAIMAVAAGETRPGTL